MRFFVPKPIAKTKQQESKALKCMRSFAKKSIGLDTTDRQIYRIEFIRDGERYDACVGLPEYDSGETVLAILEAPRSYLLCTANHGGYRGKPVVVSKRSTESVVEFDE